MSVFKVDQSGALVRAGGSFVRTSDADEIRQANQVRVSIVRGEIPWALDRGLRWLSDDSDAPGLLGKGVPLEVLSAQVRAKIAATKGIVDVLTLVATLPEPGTVRIDYTARYSLADLRSDLVSDSISMQP